MATTESNQYVSSKHSTIMSSRLPPAGEAPSERSNTNSYLDTVLDQVRELEQYRLSEAPRRILIPT